MSAIISGGEKPEDKIEVTDEMVAAGAEIIGTGDLTFTTASELAEAVYRAMEAVRRSQGSS